MRAAAATQYNGVSRNQNRSNIDKQDTKSTLRNAIHAEEVRNRTHQEIFICLLFFLDFVGQEYVCGSHALDGLFSIRMHVLSLISFHFKFVSSRNWRPRAHFVHLMCVVFFVTRCRCCL